MHEQHHPLLSREPFGGLRQEVQQHLSAPVLSVVFQ